MKNWKCGSNLGLTWSWGQREILNIIKEEKLFNSSDNNLRFSHFSIHEKHKFYIYVIFIKLLFDEYLYFRLSQVINWNTVNMLDFYLSLSPEAQTTHSKINKSCKTRCLWIKNFLTQVSRRIDKLMVEGKWSMMSSHAPWAPLQAM